jgi:hypothetical protein
MKGLKQPAFVVAATCSLLIAAGASYAAVSGPGGQAASSRRLYACVAAAGEHNELSLTSATATCPDGGHKIFWNIKGRPGKTGKHGMAGSAGATGPQGLEAPQGVQGPKGETGAQGVPGPKGDTGAQGMPGPKGDTGAQGPPGVGIDALFGDGSDGNVEISSDTTLTRDMYYNSLTIDAGVTLNPGGYRIFVAGTLTLDNGATIARNGNDTPPASVAGGPGLDPGTLGGGGYGGDPNVPGQAETNSLGGSGCGGHACGDFNGGSATPPPAGTGGAGVFRQALAAISGRSLDGQIVNGGGGGGGAAGDFGGGGGGGGVVVVAAQTVTVNGNAQVEANGGQGSPNAGGGGGGGVVVVVSDTAQPAAITLSAQGGTAPNADGSPGFTDWLN